MSYSPLYLPASIPQWGIFLGVVFVIIGYVEKKGFWTNSGWITFIVTASISLYFNLFSPLTPGEEVSESAYSALQASGWLCSAGGVLAAVTLYFRHSKRKSYKVLAVLTLIYFMIIFFQFNNITRSQKMAKKAIPQKEQGR